MRVVDSAPVYRVPTLGIRNVPLDQLLIRRLGAAQQANAAIPGDLAALWFRVRPKHRALARR
jgi:hypothetical protein